MHFLLRGVIIGILFLLSSRLARNRKGRERPRERDGKVASGTDTGRRARGGDRADAAGPEHRTAADAGATADATVACPRRAHRGATLCIRPGAF